MTWTHNGQVRNVGLGRKGVVVTSSTDQLTLFDESGAELTDAERDAIVGDFLARHSDVVMTDEAPQAQPCVCEHPLVFAAELGEGRCGLCGREPRR